MGKTTRRALLAEMDRVNRAVMGAHLRAEGYAVRAVTGLQEALRVAQDTAFDLAVCDLEIPGMDGLEFRRRLAKGASRDVPILFLTERVDRPRESFVLRDAPLLLKPVPRTHLRAALAYLRAREERRMQRDGAALSGSLLDYSVADLARFMERYGLSGRASFVHGDRSGWIQFSAGQPANAEVGHISQVDAFHRLLRWNDGTFQVDLADSRADRSIKRPLVELLLEGLARAEQWEALQARLPVEPDTRVRIGDVEAILPEEARGQVAVGRLGEAPTLRQVLSCGAFETPDALALLVQAFESGQVRQAVLKTPDLPVVTASVLPEADTLPGVQLEQDRLDELILIAQEREAAARQALFADPLDEGGSRRTSQTPPAVTMVEPPNLGLPKDEPTARAGELGGTPEADAPSEREATVEERAPAAAPRIRRADAPEVALDRAVQPEFTYEAPQLETLPADDLTPIEMGPLFEGWNTPTPGHVVTPRAAAVDVGREEQEQPLESVASGDDAETSAASPVWAPIPTGLPEVGATFDQPRATAVEGALRAAGAEIVSSRPARITRGVLDLTDFEADEREADSGEDALFGDGGAPQIRAERVEAPDQAAAIQRSHIPASREAEPYEALPPDEPLPRPERQPLAEPRYAPVPATPTPAFGSVPAAPPAPPGPEPLPGTEDTVTAAAGPRALSLAAEAVIPAPSATAASTTLARDRELVGSPSNMTTPGLGMELHVLEPGGTAPDAPLWGTEETPPAGEQHSDEGSDTPSQLGALAGVKVPPEDTRVPWQQDHRPLPWEAPSGPSPFFEPPPEGPPGRAVDVPDVRATSPEADGPATAVDASPPQFETPPPAAQTTHGTATSAPTGEATHRPRPSVEPIDLVWEPPVAELADEDEPPVAMVPPQPTRAHVEALIDEAAHRGLAPSVDTPPRSTAGPAVGPDSSASAGADASTKTAQVDPNKAADAALAALRQDPPSGITTELASDAVQLQFFRPGSEPSADEFDWPDEPPAVGRPLPQAGPTPARRALALVGIVVAVAVLIAGLLWLISALRSTPAPGVSTAGEAPPNAARRAEAQPPARPAMAKARPDPLEAQALYVAGRLSEAEQAYRALAEQDPNDEVAHVNLASVLIDRGKDKEARVMLEAWVAGHPTSAEGQLSLAVLLHQEGKLDLAHAAYERFLEFAPPGHSEIGRVHGIIDSLWPEP